MKTSKKIIGIASMLFSAFLLTACQSETKTETAGFSFPEECATCHGDDPEYQLKGARMGYDNSGHALGFERHEETHAYYSNGGGCQKCHTHEGFLEYVKTGTVDNDAYIEWPSQPGCFTCHKPHDTGDFELRKTDPVKLATGDTFDYGKGNLCANCHQSRRDPGAVVLDTPANKVSGHFGPHHGPQGDIFNGTGGAEYDGKSYSSSAHKLEIEDSCVSCHMALPEGRYSASAQIGGHSFGMHGEVHGAKKINVASCAGCHEDIKQDKSGAYYDYMAGADYDQDGTVEIAQMEVIGLLELLSNDMGTGLLQTMENPYYKADGSYINMAKDSGVTRTKNEVAALYNYKLFGEEDRSKGMHNYTYTVQVLTDTVASMDASFDTSNRPE